MEVYNVGNGDTPYDLPKGGYVWLAYSYYDGGYDGSGEAVALDEDGNIHVWNLGHCSCYGPFDEGSSVVSQEAYLGGNALMNGNDDELYTFVKGLLESKI